MPDNLTERSPERRSVRRWTTGVIVAILFVLVPPLLGMAGTAIAMMKAFETIGTTGGSDPTIMAEAIGEALMSTAIGIVVAVISVIPSIIFIVGLVRARLE